VGGLIKGAIGRGNAGLFVTRRRRKFGAEAVDGGGQVLRLANGATRSRFEHPENLRGFVAS
jgi:hypothetical protein